MPDIVMVPASVLPGDNVQYTNGIAGVALQAGDVVYLDGPTQHYLLADSNDAAKSKVRGFAGHAAAIGQPVRIQSAGILNLGGALLTVAQLYILSPITPGKMAPIADLDAGSFLVVVGVGQTTSLLQMRIWNTELAKA